MRQVNAIDVPTAGQLDDRTLVLEKLADTLTPGYEAEFDPDEAAAAGAFVEDALDVQEALESAFDLFGAKTMTDVGTRE